MAKEGRRLAIAAAAAALKQPTPTVCSGLPCQFFLLHHAKRGIDCVSELSVESRYLADDQGTCQRWQSRDLAISFHAGETKKEKKCLQIFQSCFWCFKVINFHWSVLGFVVAIHIVKRDVLSLRQGRPVYRTKHRLNDCGMAERADWHSRKGNNNNNSKIKRW